MDFDPPSRKTSSHMSFLEGLFGRTAEKDGRRGSGEFRGSETESEADSSKLDDGTDDEKIVEEMDEATVIDKLEDLLNEMNLSEEKKQPLRSLPLENKRKLLVFKMRKAKTFEKPGDFIRYLNNPNPNLEELYTCVKSLRIALRGNSLSWVKEFGDDGLRSVLHIINKCYASLDRNYDKIQIECMKCIKAFMNNTYGLQEVRQNDTALAMVARSVDVRNTAVMLEAVRTLASVCLVPPDGHGKVLQAMSKNGELRNVDRFAPVVEGLRIYYNEPLKVACFQLINAIVTTPEEVDFKLHLRNEFMRNGLESLMDELETGASEDLQAQLTIFTRHFEVDYNEFD